MVHTSSCFPFFLKTKQDGGCVRLLFVCVCVTAVGSQDEKEEFEVMSERWRVEGRGGA